MKRRAFLALGGATLLLPNIASAAKGFTDYTPGVIQTALSEGKTVFVDYAADWCSTCKSQERTIGALRGENPEYDANIVFVRVDWDDFGRHEVATSRNIPRRSTLIVLKGDEELGRIVAGTSKADIKSLLDTALAASV